MVGLGQTLRIGHLLIGGLSFHDVSDWASGHWHERAAGAGLISGSGSWPTICDQDARAGSSEDPDLKHIITHSTSTNS